MYKLIKTLLSLLTKEQLRNFQILQILVIITALTEIIGIASIAPFMALAGDSNLLNNNTMYAKIYEASGIESPKGFIFLAGLGVLIAMTTGAILSTITVWRLSLFATRVGTEIGDRLYRHYMYQSWLFHATHSSSELTKQISSEASRVTAQILQPLMHLNARIVLMIFIVVSITIYNPAVAVIGIALFSNGYLMLYKIVRSKLQKNGRKISSLSTSRFKLMSEGFGGIKDIILLGRQDDFVQRFEISGSAFSKAQGTNTALAQVPRYFMELLAFGSIIGLILYLVSNEQGNIEDVLPTLSLYALAGFKLLPAMQQIYSSIASIKGGQGAFESIHRHLIESKNSFLPIQREKNNKISIKKSIVLKNVNFSYPQKKTKALDCFNLEIPANSTIGIVGPSGSGKSTAIDIILGLIQPQDGSLIIDDHEINSNNIRSWQNIIGFVPQSIFLSEGTIAENIAFGIPTSSINREQVNKSLKLAHLDELILNLPEGIDTKVGERGVQLSGGQRQRIGIARALYNDASVLVFDEATSALDGITEKMIMDAINDFNGKKTIIMIAHRLNTIAKCQIIFYIKNGQVIDSGTFQELLRKNEDFKKMAEHS